MANIKSELPRILPTDEVVVSNEKIRYQTFKQDTEIVEQTSYTLEKAPITRINEVTGIVGGKSVTFNKGVDYRLSDDSTDIVWIDDSTNSNTNPKRPDAGSVFEVTYRADSVLGRYAETGGEELTSVESKIQSVQDKKLIDNATGQDLDEIGKLFGPLGDRRERNDTEYRILLKSIVQSFVSRGTRSDIKRALAAATDVPLSDIEITEDFEKQAYGVSIVADTPITGSLVEEVAEIADPSGVDLDKTTFILPPEITNIDDTNSLTFGTPLSDEIITVNEQIQSPRGEAVDDVLSKDFLQVNDNNIIITDELLSDEAVIIDGNNVIVTDVTAAIDNVLLNPNVVSQSDTTVINDIPAFDNKKSIESVGVDERSILTDDKTVFRQLWEENSWQFFQWTEINDVVETVNIDTSKSTDSVFIISNTRSPSDSVFAVDTIDSDSSEKIRDNTIVIDSITPDASKNIDDNTIVIDSITPDASKKIDDITQSSDVTQLDVDDNNSFDWTEDDWNFFEWTEITNIGKISLPDDDTIVSDVSFQTVSDVSISDITISDDASSQTAHPIEWDNEWGELYWDVQNTAATFDFESNLWQSSSWNDLTWAP